MPLIVADGTEQLESGFQVFTNFTDRGQVTTPVTVIGGTPHGDDVLVGEVVFVSFVHQLMRASDQGEIVDMAEFISYAVTKQPT